MALLELTDISKSFGGVQALRNVDFTLNAGEIHGLAGENGAGKSTMMKIIAGVHTADSGTMRVDGKAVHFRSTRDALAASIGMVHQELSVAPELTVAENVFFGNQPVNGMGIVTWRRMAERAAEELKNLGLDINPRARLGDFPIGVQQLVELSRVLFSGARIIILDEPTSALSPPENPATECRSGPRETQRRSPQRREPAGPDGSVCVEVVMARAAARGE